MADFSRLIGHGLGVAGSLVQGRVQDAFDNQNGIGQAAILQSTVTPTETSIPHGLGRKPQAVLLGIPSAAASIFQSREADERFVYLSTAASTTNVTIVVF